MRNSAESLLALVFLDHRDSVIVYFTQLARSASGSRIASRRNSTNMLDPKRVVRREASFERVWLAKIRSAFKMNDIRGGRNMLPMDDIQAFRTGLGEGQDTQPQTPRPTLLVDIQEQNPFNF